MGRVGEAFDPDVVLLVFFLREGMPRGQNVMDRIFVPARQVAVLEQRSLLYRYSYLDRWLRDRADRDEIGRRYIASYQDWYFGTDAQTTEWRAAQRNLLALRERIQMLRPQRRVALVVYPILFELNDRYPFKPITDRVEQFGAEHGFPVQNLLPAFLGREGADLWVSAYDQHPNAVCHRIAAEALLPFASQLLEEGPHDGH